MMNELCLGLCSFAERWNRKVGKGDFPITDEITRNMSIYLDREAEYYGDPNTGAEILFFTAKNGDLYFLAFPTDEEIDRRENADFLLTKIDKSNTDICVHRGFLNQAKALVDFVSKKLIPGKNIYFVGFSLGAAVSQLMGYLFRNYNPIVFAAASPRVGNRSWANWINENMNLTRLVLEGDLVTRLPPAPLYVHPKTLIYMKADGTKSNSIPWYKQFVCQYSTKKHNTELYYKTYFLK